MEKMTIKAEGRLKEKILNDKKNPHLYGKLSFSTLCELCFTDMILCNNITEMEDFWDSFYELNYQKFEEAFVEEYGEEELENFDFWEEVGEFFQFYIVNKDFDFKRYEECFTMGYCPKLDLDILCVGHWGTSWSYVPTNVRIED